MSDERLSDVTKSVSLLALCSPTAASGWFPEHIPEEEEEEEDAEPDAPCTARPRRLSGPIVYGRE